MSEISESSIHEPFKVNWFAPDRPVGGGTMFVRPEDDADGVGDADGDAGAEQ
jgi:hypothetical protein